MAEHLGRPRRSTVRPARSAVRAKNVVRRGLRIVRGQVAYAIGVAQQQSMRWDLRQRAGLARKIVDGREALRLRPGASSGTSTCVARSPQEATTGTLARRPIHGEKDGQGRGAAREARADEKATERKGRIRTPPVGRPLRGRTVGSEIVRSLRSLQSILTRHHDDRDTRHVMVARLMQPGQENHPRFLRRVEGLRPPTLMNGCRGKHLRQFRSEPNVLPQ